MKAKLLLLTLLAILLLPALSNDSGRAAADPAALSPISTSLVCDGVNYPACSPGGSCQDPCCYCECRAEGRGPGPCSFECCQGH